MSSSRVSDALASRLYAESGAARWQLPPEAFRAAVDASVMHAFGERVPSAGDVERHVRALHLEDLALAAACRAGIDAAWDHFVRTFRPALLRAADAMDPTGAAREIADGLYGELFATGTADDERQPLLRYFHGRSSLGTWLRAVLAQRFVDHTRARRRLEPLAEDDVRPAAASNPDGLRLVTALAAALTGALAALAPRDRLRLACYYAHDLTLAAIGRALGEHEATASRQLARTRRQLRHDIEKRLGAEHGLDAQAIAHAWSVVLDDPGPLDLATIARDPVARKIAEAVRSKRSNRPEDRDDRNKERM